LNLITGLISFLEYSYRFLDFLGGIQDSILNRLPSQVDSADCKPVN